MNEKQNKIDRRNFLKAAGAAGLGPVLASTGATANQDKENTEEKIQKPKYPQVPKRKLGKTGIKVPCLALGGNQDLIANRIVLIKAPQWGLTYWDTAHNYRGGNSELGIGKYLSKNPQVRKNLFIVTKASGARNLTDVQERFELSLKRMNTDYIDLYYGVHQCPDPAQLTDELKKWAENAKKQKLIRYFGITTHENMPKVLAAAAKCDWIDVVMTIYNFRLMQDSRLNDAIDECHKAKIGIIAMKTQGMRQKIETEKDKKLVEHFLQRGFTEGQAKLKLVLEDKRFTAVCVGMQNLALLNSNVAAVLDKSELTQDDMAVFRQYAQATCSGYCAGCADICNAALPDTPYVSDIMRYLMYYKSYDEKTEAKRLFAQIPVGVRNKLLNMNYSLAEARCPQHLPIRELIAEAVGKLA